MKSQAVTQGFSHKPVGLAPHGLKHGDPKVLATVYGCDRCKGGFKHSQLTTVHHQSNFRKDLASTFAPHKDGSLCFPCVRELLAKAGA